jgi:hypothetical protein
MKAGGGCTEGTEEEAQRPQRERPQRKKRKVSCEKLLIHVGALESAGSERFGLGLGRRVDGYLVIAG